MPTINTVNNQFLNNVTVTTAVAAATSSVTIENLDNTNAASHAKAAITTGGASGGDAFIHFTNNVVDWTIGVDNSDSDAFVISQSATPGTTNAARCDTAGEWTYPLQPGFCAQKDADALNVTGAGALYTVVGNVETADRTADYSTVTGNFTAAVTGKYLLSASVMLKGNTIGYNTSNSIVTSNRFYYLESRHPASNENCAAGGSVIADMDAADTAYSAVKGEGEAGNTADFNGTTDNNHFSGALLQ